VDLCGRLWDTRGIGTLSFRAVWTAVDTHGRRLEIYGSEGWGFESLRACYRNPCVSGGIVVWRVRLSAGGCRAYDSWMTLAISSAISTMP
jgi:hypothetical protein